MALLLPCPFLPVPGGNLSKLDAGTSLRVSRASRCHSNYHGARKCGFSAKPGSKRTSVLIDHAGNRHECAVRNDVPFLGQDYAFPALGVSAEEMLDEIMPGGHDEQDGDRPGVVHDLTHLRKRHDCEACQAKIKMSPARRKDPLMRERPSGWAHTLLAPWLTTSARATGKLRNKTSRCVWCFCVLAHRSAMSFP